MLKTKTRKGITQKKQKQQSLTKIGQDNNIIAGTKIRITTNSDTD